MSSSINGLGSNSPIQKITQQPIRTEIPTDAPPPQPARGADKLELSGMTHLLKTLKSNDVRTDKVAQVKAEIEAGKYETDEKLDAAIDRLLDDLQK
jgi:anti-sigma28 factor (negative regulator of flagellin synthesis)